MCLAAFVMRRSRRQPDQTRPDLALVSDVPQQALLASFVTMSTGEGSRSRVTQTGNLICSKQMAHASLETADSTSDHGKLSKDDLDRPYHTIWLHVGGYDPELEAEACAVCRERVSGIDKIMNAQCTIDADLILFV